MICIDLGLAGRRIGESKGGRFEQKKVKEANLVRVKGSCIVGEKNIGIVKRRKRVSGTQRKSNGRGMEEEVIGRERER